MKVRGVVRYNSIPVAIMFKKRICPECGVKLKKQTTSIIADGSPETKRYCVPEIYGPVKVILTEFTCPTCQKIYTHEDLYDIEKEKRRKEKEQKRLEKQRKLEEAKK